jgi:dTDP-4-dehydrorhamnose reductase
MTTKPRQTVLILGSTGLLGVPLASYLESLGHKVVRHSAAKSSDISFDLTNETEVSQKLLEIRPSVIINLVALTNVDACEKDPVLAYHLNAKPLVCLNDYIEKNRDSYLIHISTDQVYSGSGEQAEDEVEPLNYYAYSKLLSEQYAKGPRSLILRTNFFGKSQTEGRVSFSDFIWNSMKEGNEITLVDDVYFCPLHYQTICEVIAESIEKKPFGIFNLGSKSGCSKKDFGLKVMELLDGKLNYKVASMDDLSLSAPRPKDMRMNVVEIEKILNIKLPSLDQEVNRLRIDYGKMEHSL